MIEVEEKNVGVIFPSQQIKMVAMQPHIHLTDTEPFRWPDDKKTKQIAGINRTLEIARDQQAHFTLFPEYSIPGLDAIDSISELVTDGQWPNSSVVIGGVDGLSNGEYQQLCQQPNTICHGNNTPDQVAQNEWVNCSITWVKDNSGSVTRYIQPKICRAWPEKNIHWQEMFCGKAIYLFNAKYDNGDFPFSFISLICFDWIGRIDGSNTKVVDGFLQTMNRVFAGAPQYLHWVFILQENDEPNHDMFIQRTSAFLTQRSTYPMVDRQKSTIVFVNNSTKTVGGTIITSDRAFTSCVFPADVSFDTQGCPPTFSFASERFRGKLINRCNDIIFRELRPCIHSFKVGVAQFLNLTQDSRCHPIENASVHSLDEDLDDPRFPGGPVPACVKWVNDNLDNSLPLSNHVHIDHLRNETETSHNTVVEAIRQLTANEHEKNIHYATASHLSKTSNNEWRNADNWVTEERGALEHMLNTLTMINTACNTELQNCSLHATTLIDGTPVEIVAVKGTTHDECFKYFCEYITPPTNKVFLITQDNHNSVITDGLLKKFTVGDPSKSTIIRPRCKPKDYQTLQQTFQRADSVENFGREVARYVA